MSFFYVTMVSQLHYTYGFISFYETYVYNFDILKIRQYPIYSIHCTFKNTYLHTIKCNLWFQVFLDSKDSYSIYIYKVISTLPVVTLHNVTMCYLFGMVNEYVSENN